MKTILSLICLSFILVACSEKKTGTKLDIETVKDVSLLKKERDALLAAQHNLEEQIAAIDARVDALTPQKKLPLITTITAKSAPFEHYLELQGNVETKQNLVVTPEMAGILKQVYVKEGQRVSKGQVLARVDDGGLSQQLAQMEIQSNLAKTTFERQQRLWNEKIGSELQFLQAKSAYDGQLKAIDQLKTQIEKTVVRAPFSGIIDDVITEAGNVIAPGQTPLFRLVNLKNMYISTEVPERYLTQVTKNKKVEVFFPVLNKTYNTKIRQTSNFINPANRTFRVEIAIPNKDRLIKPNLTAKLKVNDYTNENAVLIPQNIISENAKGEQYIFTLKNKENAVATAQYTIIKTGKTQGDLIEVLEGLQDNVEVIKEGARSVENEQKVKIIE